MCHLRGAKEVHGSYFQQDRNCPIQVKTMIFLQTGSRLERKNRARESCRKKSDLNYKGHVRCAGPENCTCRHSFLEMVINCQHGNYAIQESEQLAKRRLLLCFQQKRTSKTETNEVCKAQGEISDASLGCSMGMKRLEVVWPALGPSQKSNRIILAG